MCLTGNQGLDWLIDETSKWINPEKSEAETALIILKDNSSTQDKIEALEVLNDFYWDSEQITDYDCYGQSLLAASRTVDPNRPFPEVRV